MKIRMFFTLIVAGLALVSCEDYLEIEPKDMLSDLSAWTSTENADIFLNNIYGGIPDYFSNTITASCYEDHFADHLLNGINWELSRTYAFGAFTPTNTVWKWGYYSNIRACNLFIANVTNSTLDDIWKKGRLAEARFIRAYFYWWMYVWHGGVPIITDVLNYSAQGDEIFRARNTAEETVQFIIDECTAIADDLPLRTEQTGRITRGATLMLKAGCELYHASPYYNESNDKSRWTVAAATYRQVMDLNVYNLFPDHRTLFLEENNFNQEIIFAKGKKTNTAFADSREGMHGPIKVNGTMHSWGASCPTQQLVDQYAMSNGLPITDPASGYDPQNPYLNREKRFYNDILYSGSEWLGHTLLLYTGASDGTELDLGDENISSNTGYYLKKMMDEKYAFNGFHGLGGANVILFRYAEALLGYAEAQNEAVGPDASVYDAINQVRNRVDLPELKTGLTQTQMREAIRKERAVELAFENKRFFDVLRWKIAETVLNEPSLAMKIDLIDGKKVFTVIPAPGGTRVFKNYLMPIPQSAIDQNPKLVQNPGY